MKCTLTSAKYLIAYIAQHSAKKTSTVWVPCRGAIYANYLFHNLIKYIEYEIKITVKFLPILEKKTFTSNNLNSIECGGFIRFLINDLYDDSHN